MDLTAWALYLLIAGAISGAAFLHYRLREPGGTGRRLLALLRGAVLAVLVLLLFNPRVPVGRASAPSLLALVDGSASMALPDTAGGTPWRAALDAVETLHPDRVVVAGAAGAAPIHETTPDGRDSRLGPALRAAAESGADRVILWTDGAVEDASEIRRLADGPTAVEVRVVGTPRAFNAGVASVSAPDWVAPGETDTVRVGVAAVGVGGPDSVAVVLRRDGRTLARGRVPTPAPGREWIVELLFSAGPEAGLDRLEVAVVDGGSVEDDDVRTVYTRVGAAPGGVVVVSLAPGQEPRFLIPVIRRATGLPVRAWAAVAEGRWVRIGDGAEAGRIDPEEAPRQALEDADMAVIHGLDAAAPDWVKRAAATAPRLLAFPGDDAPGLPLAPGPARVADWYVADGVPASPVAALMAGAATTGLPPLSALRTPPVGRFWAPWLARAGRRGEARPVLLAGRVEGRRVAVALGDGYWRWAFAGDVGRAAYDRFWSAVTGWLAEVEPDAVEGMVPVDRVVARGTSPRWRVPGGADSVRVRLERIGGVDTTLEGVWAVRDGVVALPPVPPGRYRYEVGGGAEGGSGAGEITVERYSAEWTRPVRLASMAAGETRSESVTRRPLRSVPWGYVVVLVLLSVEWVLRRRWGLR